MSLSVGIVGLANVGKSTLFEALTKKQVNISNYPFCTIDPNVGVVELPDARLDKLAEISKSAKKIPAIVQFTDIAGLVKDAHKGEGLGNKFLANIRETDAILFVVRCFENSEIVHVEKTIDPVRDIDIVNMELMLKDLETLEKRIQKAEADGKSGKEVITDELDFLKKLKASLEQGNLARQFAEQNEGILKELQVLTAKPSIFVLNSNKEEIPSELEKKIKDLDSEYIIANLRDECDSNKFTEEEKNELGLTESKLNQIIEKSYKVLGLITFYTTGPDETRAWTIKQGTLAPQAAGVIHTDFENKFICIDTINYQKLFDIAKQNPEGDPWSQAARFGQLRTEGKEYIIQDGDVIVVKHGQ
ncbi:MAG: redox-regulated ATPase YchF [Parcubacteria group bacterium]